LIKQPPTLFSHKRKLRDVMAITPSLRRLKVTGKNAESGQRDCPKRKWLAQPLVTTGGGGALPLPTQVCAEAATLECASAAAVSKTSAFMALFSYRVMTNEIS
jgi:hypothetical protein